MQVCGCNAKHAHFDDSVRICAGSSFEILQLQTLRKKLNFLLEYVLKLEFLRYNLEPFRHVLYEKKKIT